eukprot:12199641-Alexandrium_andersonii.AAC.1
MACRPKTLAEQSSAFIPSGGGLQPPRTPPTGASGAPEAPVGPLGQRRQPGGPGGQQPRRNCKHSRPLGMHRQS